MPGFCTSVRFTQTPDTLSRRSCALRAEEFSIASRETTLTEAGVW